MRYYDKPQSLSTPPLEMSNLHGEEEEEEVQPSGLHGDSGHAGQQRAPVARRSAAGRKVRRVVHALWESQLA